MMARIAFDCRIVMPHAWRDVGCICLSDVSGYYEAQEVNSRVFLFNHFGDIFGHDVFSTGFY